MTPRLVANLLWIPALAVGALQMFHINAGALTNWGADFFGPIALYGSLRTDGTILRWFSVAAPSPLSSALIVLFGCIAWEAGQLFGLVPGHYDPIDIAAYVVGVAAALGTEKTVQRLQRFLAVRHR